FPYTRPFGSRGGLERETGVAVPQRREPRTLRSQLDASTSPRGLAVNPSQVGFHHIKREFRPIPFTTGREKRNSLQPGASDNLPDLLDHIDVTGRNDGGGSSRGTAHSPGARPDAA